MRVLAYCGASFEEATRRAAGVKPLTCPPLTAARFDPRQLNGYDFLYFDLHGDPGGEEWYEIKESDGPLALLTPERVPALTAAQIRQARLDGAVVFATCCYLADEDSPMLDALLEAGAAYVIGGDGKNWAAAKRPSGASYLGEQFRHWLERGYDPLKALTYAKRLLRLKKGVSGLLGNLASTGAVDSTADTLAFRAYYREKR